MLGSAASLLVQLVSLVVLSRLLNPADFGLVAMVSVFVVLGNLLRDFGLPMAGLQLRTLSAQQAANLFWMNMGVAALVAGALVAATPGLVLLYDEPRLAAIVPALAVVVFLGGVTAQIQVNLARRMRFVTLVVTDVGAQVLGLTTAIVLAIAGAGYWALVAQTVVTAGILLASRWVASAWLPARFRRGHGSVGLLRVGANYGAAQLLAFLQSNVDTVVIGTQYGAAPLGYYSRAYQMLTAPAARLLDPLTQVVVTTLNQVKTEGRDPHPALLRIQFALGAFIVWLFAVSAGVAANLIPFVLGAQWTPSIPVFQILAIGGCVWVFNHVSYWVFIVNEKSRELLRYNLVSKPIAIACILAGAPFGITGVAWGYVAAMAVSWPLNLVWLSRTAGLTALPFAANGVRILAAGAVGAACAAGVTSLGADLPALVAIVLGLLAGTVGMLLILLVLPPTRRHLAEARRTAASALRQKREAPYAPD